MAFVDTSETQVRRATLASALDTYGAAGPEGPTFNLSLLSNPHTYLLDLGQHLYRHLTSGQGDIRVRGFDQRENPNLSIFNQIEDLLAQASRLLERCLADKIAYDQMNTERFKVRLEIGELLATHEIYDDQMQDEEYRLFRQREARKESEIIDQQLAVNMMAHNAIPEDSPPLSDEEKATSPRQFSLALYRLCTLSHSAWTDSTDEVRLRWLYSLLGSIIDRSETLAARAALNVRKELCAERMNFHGKDANYLVRQREIGRASLYMKMKEYIARDGALNYNDRIRSLVVRCERDFAEAYMKMAALERGITLIARRTVRPVRSIWEQGRPIDEAIAWIREASLQVGDFLLRQSQFAHRISLRQRLTGADGDETLASLVAGEPGFFEVRPGELPENARLLGISAIAMGAGETLWYPVEISIPPQSLGQGIELSATTCRLGRVASLRPGQTPDIGGVPVIRNRSPIGTWRVQHVGDASVSVPHDIVIDLMLSADAR